MKLAYFIVVLVLGMIPEGCLSKDKLFGTKQIYLVQFGMAHSKHTEIQYIKQVFQTISAKISRDEYIKVIIDHLNGVAHGHPVSADIRPVVERQVRRFAEAYLDKENNQPAYSIHDVYEDLISTKLQNWIEFHHSDVNPVLEPTEPEQYRDEDL